MEERKTRQEYEKYLFDIDLFGANQIWKIFFFKIYMFGKFTSKFTVSKGTRSHLQVGRLLLPSHIFLLKLQVQDAGCWSSVKLVFLCTRHSWLHGYVQSHPVHICVIRITTIICQKDCIIIQN